MKEIYQIFQDSWEVLDSKDCIDAINTLGVILNIKVNIPNHYNNIDKTSPVYESFKELYNISTNEIINEFSSCSGHTVTNLLRGIGLSNEVEYKEILSGCCSQLNINYNKSFDSEKIEKLILEQFLNDIWSSLNEEQKNNLKAEIVSIAKKQDDNILLNALLTGSPLGTILAFKSAGFGVFLAATTALKSISLLIGKTFSFGIYSTLTKGISIVLGPVGLIAASVWGIYKIGEPNYKNKIIPAIFVFSYLRASINIKK